MISIGNAKDSFEFQGGSFAIPSNSWIPSNSKGPPLDSLVSIGNAKDSKGAPLAYHWKSMVPMEIQRIPKGLLWHISGIPIFGSEWKCKGCQWEYKGFQRGSFGISVGINDLDGNAKDAKAPPILLAGLKHGCGILAVLRNRLEGRGPREWRRRQEGNPRWAPRDLWDWQRPGSISLEGLLHS